MEVFHYTPDYNWRYIKLLKDEGVEEGKGVNGWTVAFLEPEPQEWTHNPQFPNAWKDFMRGCGEITFPGEVVHTDRLVLLALDIDVDNPNIFVTDRGILEKAERELGSDTDQMRGQQQILDAYYYENRVPLAEYLDRREKFRFLLPEVQIGEPISLTRVRPYNYQPALERHIQLRSRGDLFSQKWMAEWEAKFLGLEEWYGSYCQRNPEMTITFLDYLQAGTRRFLHTLGLS